MQLTWLILTACVACTAAHPVLKSLKDDLDEILALVPTDKLVTLYHKYEQDPDIVKIHNYLHGPEFAKVVDIVAHVDEIKALVGYLEEKGVPAITIINELADHFGWPHWGTKLSTTVTKRSLHSWQDMAAEIRQIVPITDIINLVMDKLANSEDFQDLYNRIASVDYQKLHDDALSHPEIKDMVDRLKALGVDVLGIWEKVKDFFGWSFRRSALKSLKDDLEELLALIPTDQVLELYKKYENDADVQKVLAYLKSDEFKKVVVIVQGVDEVKHIVDFVGKKGVPIVDFLNKVADVFGLPHWPASVSRAMSSRSWQNFAEELKKIIPVEQIIGLVLDKLANSEDFQDLYNEVASVDYQKLYDDAFSHPEIKDLIDRLSAMGVDVDAIWKAVKDFFGWE